MKKLVVSFFFLLSIFFISCEEEKPEPPVTEPPQIEYFSVNSTTVFKGDVVTLSWSVKNSESVSIDHGVGSISASGSLDLTMNEYGKTTFTLTATNSIGSATAAVNVTVNVLITKLWENRFEYDDGSEWPETTGPQIDDMIILSDGGFALVGNVYNCNGYPHPILVRFDNQ